MADICPTGTAKRTDPKSASFNPNALLMSGMRDAQLANTKP